MNQVYILSIQQMIDMANGGKFPGTGYNGIPPTYLNGGTAAGDHSGTSSAMVLGEAAALNALIAAGFNEDYITSAAGGKKEYFLSLGGAIGNALIIIGQVQASLTNIQGLTNAFNTSITLLADEIEQFQTRNPFSNPVSPKLKKRAMFSSSGFKNGGMSSNGMSTKGTTAPPSLLQSALKMQSLLGNNQTILRQINPLMETISNQLAELESLPSSGITNIVPQLQTLLTSMEQSTTNVTNATSRLAAVTAYWEGLPSYDTTALITRIRYLVGVIEAFTTGITSSTESLARTTAELEAPDTSQLFQEVQNSFVPVQISTENILSAIASIVAMVSGIATSASPSLVVRELLLPLSQIQDLTDAATNALDNLGTAVNALSSVPPSGIHATASEIEALSGNIEHLTTDVNNATASLTSATTTWEDVPNVTTAALVTQIERLTTIIQASTTNINAITEILSHNNW